jgi:ABC-type sugar transport system ATPase subunit
MGRAIVREPVAFLMDEPLSNLDAKLRVGMRAELARLHERFGRTTVYADSALPAIEVQVEVLEELGSDAHVNFRVDAPRVETEEVRAVSEEEDEALLADERTSLFNARVNPATTARVGERLALTVDTRTLHFFDPGTGESLSRAA